MTIDQGHRIQRITNASFGASSSSSDFSAHWGNQTPELNLDALPKDAVHRFNLLAEKAVNDNDEEALAEFINLFTDGAQIAVFPSDKNHDVISNSGKDKGLFFRGFHAHEESQNGRRVGRQFEPRSEGIG